MSKTFKQRIPRGFVWQKNHSIAYPFDVDSIAAKSKFLGQANSLTFTILKKFCSFHGTPLVYINSIYYFDELSIAFFMPAQSRLRPKADHLRGTQAAEIFFRAQSQRDPQPVISDVIGKERAAENQLVIRFQLIHRRGTGTCILILEAICRHWKNSIGGEATQGDRSRVVNFSYY